MPKRLEPIDDDNVVYDMPTDEDLVDLGIDPVCIHGYNHWSVCSECCTLLVGILWDSLLRERGM